MTYSRFLFSSPLIILPFTVLFFMPVAISLNPTVKWFWFLPIPSFHFEVVGSGKGFQSVRTKLHRLEIIDRELVTGITGQSETTTTTTTPRETGVSVWSLNNDSEGSSALRNAFYLYFVLTSQFSVLSSVLVLLLIWLLINEHSHWSLSAFSLITPLSCPFTSSSTEIRSKECRPRLPFPSHSHMNVNFTEHWAEQ